MRYVAQPFAQRLIPALVRVDWVLVGSALLLLGLGVALLASPSASGTQGSAYAIKQLKFLGLGILVFIALQKVDYLTMLRWSPVFYFICLVLLCIVLLTKPINGARSWFNLYFLNLQPSELMKPILILTLAHYLMYRESFKRFMGLFVPLILCLVPMALILRQPDMGTALVMAPICFSMLFGAGARLKHLLLIGLSSVMGLAGMWFTVMNTEQKGRIRAWLNPDEYRLGDAWQLTQSEMAIGSGELSGMGFHPDARIGLSKFSEKHTDFIFAVIGETGGFLLSALVLALLLIVGLSGLGIALRTREPAGRLIAIGVSMLIFSQGMINVGVAVGLLPTTGVTFPFVSYGGSSLISSMICLALLVNIGVRREPVLARSTFG